MNNAVMSIVPLISTALAALTALLIAHPGELRARIAELRAETNDLRRYLDETKAKCDERIEEVRNEGLAAVQTITEQYTAAIAKQAASASVAVALQKVESEKPEAERNPVVSEAIAQLTPKVE